MKLSQMDTFYIQIQAVLTWVKLLHKAKNARDVIAINDVFYLFKLDELTDEKAVQMLKICQFLLSCNVANNQFVYKYRYMLYNTFSFTNGRQIWKNV